MSHVSCIHMASVQVHSFATFMFWVLQSMITGRLIADFTARLCPQYYLPTDSAVLVD